MASILNVDQIKNAAGTSAMTIDSSGRVSKSVIPYAFVTFPGTDTYVSKTANDIVDFLLLLLMMEIITILLPINLLAQ